MSAAAFFFPFPVMASVSMKTMNPNREKNNSTMSSNQFRTRTRVGFCTTQASLVLCRKDADQLMRSTSSPFLAEHACIDSAPPS